MTGGLFIPTDGECDGHNVVQPETKGLDPSGPPSVSIVIAARNNAPYLAEAIESALNQTVSCQLIYADDCSIDDSVNIARSYTRAGIEVLPATEHSGVCETRNRGARRAHGTYLIFLDGDDVMPPDFVERHLAAMQPGCPFVYGPAQAFGDFNLFWDAPVWEISDLWRNNFVNTSAMWSRWAFYAAGEWRDGIKTMWDWDLALRGSRFGKPRRSSAVLNYRQHSSSWSANNREKTHAQQERYMPVVRRLNARLSVGSIISGRVLELFPQWISALAQAVRLIDMPHRPELVLLDNTRSDNARPMLSAEAHRYRLSFESIRIVPFDRVYAWTTERQRRNAVADFMASACNRLTVDEMRGDIHWLVEDDILVPIQGGNDLFTTLISGWTPPNAVAGCYRNRHLPAQFVGGRWRDGSPEEFQELPAATLDVDLAGTGCLMYWASRAPRFWQSHCGDIPAHDWEWCTRLKQSGGKLLMLPDVRCGHALDAHKILWA